MRSSRVWMRSSRVWMRSSRVWWDLAECGWELAYLWMRFSRVCGWDLSEWLERLTVNAVVATDLGWIPASSDIMESEGRQMKQRWIKCIKNYSWGYSICTDPTSSIKSHQSSQAGTLTSPCLLTVCSSPRDSPKFKQGQWEKNSRNKQLIRTQGQ